jgi:hypothetical protein
MSIATAIQKLRSKSRVELLVALRGRFLRHVVAQTFRFPSIPFSPTVRMFLPGSFWIYRRHPEYAELYRRFTARNLLNRGDTGRLMAFILNIKQVLADGIEGDFAELGVWRGNSAAILAYYAHRSGRRVVLFDTFEGFNAADLKGIDAGKSERTVFDNTSMAIVAATVGYPTSVDYVKGYFPDSAINPLSDRQYSIVSLDCDLYAPMKAGLEFFYTRMSPGGLFLLHDYSSVTWAGAKQAIDEFCTTTGEHLILMPDGAGSALFRKTHESSRVTSSLSCF